MICPVNLMSATEVTFFSFLLTAFNSSLTCKARLFNYFRNLKIYPMKRPFYLLLALGLVLSGTACKKDAVVENILNYDGENATGPLLAAGYHEAAARFTSDRTAAFAGKQLIAVQYFMGAKPQKAEIRIYGEGIPTFPGTLLYVADITDEIRTLRWSEHILDTPVDITGEDLWISIALTHAAQQQSIGCDAGPNRANGDWLYQSTDGLWESYRNRTGEGINWNIRGKVSE